MDTKAGKPAGMSDRTKSFLAAAAVIGGLYFWSHQDSTKHQDSAVQSDCRYEGTWVNSQSDETMTLGCLRPVGAHYEGSYELRTGPRAFIHININGGYKIKNGQFLMSGNDESNAKREFSAGMKVDNPNAPREIVFDLQNRIQPGPTIFRRL